MDSCEECECDSTDIYTGSLLHSDWPGGNESKDGWHVRRHHIHFSRKNVIDMMMLQCKG